MTETVPTAAEGQFDRLARLRTEAVERGAVEAVTRLGEHRRRYVLAQAWEEQKLLCGAGFFDAIEGDLPALVRTVRVRSDYREQVFAARQWWRDLRQRESDRAAARAAAMPEFIESSPDLWGEP